MATDSLPQRVIHPIHPSWCKFCGKQQTTSSLLKHQHVCRMNPANQPLAEPYPSGCPYLAASSCGHIYCQLLNNASGRIHRVTVPGIGYAVVTNPERFEQPDGEL